MTFPCSGVILADDFNSRLNDENKSFIEIGGKSIFQRLYEVYAELFDEIIVVCSDPTAYLACNVQIVTGLFDFHNSLSGVHAGLFTVRNPFAFFCTCDAPFLQKDLVKSLLAQIEHRWQVVLPKSVDGCHIPLCAVYAKSCIGPIETLLASKKPNITKLFDRVRIKSIPAEVLRPSDPELISFFNVNTSEDLTKAVSRQC